MRRGLEFLGAIWELARLGLTTRMRLGGAYWRWRNETAFGAHPPSPRERRRAAIEYGRWVRRMKKLR